MSEESQIEVEAIWNDIDFFEIRVKASNGRFMGTTAVYVTEQQLSDFAAKLVDFPQKSTDILLFEAGEDFVPGQGYPLDLLILKVFCENEVGHTKIQINIGENSRKFSNIEGKSEAVFNLDCYPEQLKRFGRQLIKIAKCRKGTAFLSPKTD